MAVYLGDWYVGQVLNKEGQEGEGAHYLLVEDVHLEHAEEQYPVPVPASHPLRIHTVLLKPLIRLRKEHPWKLHRSQNSF